MHLKVNDKVWTPFYPSGWYKVIKVGKPCRGCKTFHAFRRLGKFSLGHERAILMPVEGPQNPIAVTVDGKKNLGDLVPSFFLNQIKTTNDADGPSGWPSPLPPQRIALSIEEAYKAMMDDTSFSGYKITSVRSDNCITVSGLYGYFTLEAVVKYGISKER